MQWTKVAFIRHAFFIFWGILIFLWRIENINKLKIETLNLIIIGTHCYQPYVLGPTLQISVSKFMGLNEEKGLMLDTPFCYPWLKALYHTFATDFFSLHFTLWVCHCTQEWITKEWGLHFVCFVCFVKHTLWLNNAKFVLWTMVLNWDSSPHSTHNLCCVRHFFSLV